MVNRSIPSAVRTTVWLTYMGDNSAKGKCLVGCGSTISWNNFECGHIVSRAKGGDTTINNLRPICSRCNKSMGTTNMIEFINKYGFASPLVQNNKSVKDSSKKSTKLIKHRPKKISTQPVKWDIKCNKTSLKKISAFGRILYFVQMPDKIKGTFDLVAELEYHDNLKCQIMYHSMVYVANEELKNNLANGRIIIGYNKTFSNGDTQESKNNRVVELNAGWINCLTIYFYETDDYNNKTYIDPADNWTINLKFL